MLLLVAVMTVMILKQANSHRNSMKKLLTLTARNLLFPVRHKHFPCQDHLLQDRRQVTLVLPLPQPPASCLLLEDPTKAGCPAPPGSRREGDAPVPS